LLVFDVVALCLFFSYEFSFCPLQLVPFSGWVDAHTFHHTYNTGNYGLYWSFWDDLMGTNVDYKEYIKRQVQGCSEPETHQQ
jgi:sterol desaturase/sphingolipid hydroxylase (fatty acid hydroxylase superfamily)